MLFLELFFACCCAICSTQVLAQSPMELGSFKNVLKSLDPHFIPAWKQNEPVYVTVGFYIESLSNFAPTDMAFDVDLYLRQSWFDSRLQHNHTTFYSIQDDLAIDKLWKPDIMIANARSAVFQKFSQPNRLVYIFPDGHVHFSIRVIANIACNLDLRYYPMDKQECFIKFTSYAHPESELIMMWYPVNAIGYNSQIRLPEMTLLSIETDTCHYINYTYGQTGHNHLVGNWSCLKANLLLSRAIGYHLTQTYVPTAMIVMISWISFWIDPTAVPARISLSFTTLLTLSTMAAGVRISLPPVSYAKAIDYWVGACMIMVFAALLEFALVNSFVRRATVLRGAMLSRLPDDVQRLTVNPTGPEDLHIGLLKPKEDQDSTKLMEGSARNSKIAKLIDKLSRICFPAAFFIFNLLYWIVFSY